MNRDESNVESGPQHEIYNIKKDDVCQRLPFCIHQGGSNYNFADGHAKFTPGERIQGGAADKREYPIVNPNSDRWQ